MPRWIYWAEKRIVHEVLEQLPEQGVLPHQADAEDLLALLHKRGAVIVCDHATLTVDDPTTDEPENRPAPPARAPAAPGERPPEREQQKTPPQPSEKDGSGGG
jgi:hypothetical protein